MNSIEKTKKFTDLARKMYEFDKDNPTAEKDWLTMLLSFSNGFCGMCRRPLIVKNIQINFQGTKYYFECGHMYGLMKVDDKTSKIRDPNLSFNRVSIALNPDAPNIKATHSGPKIKTEHSELEIARKFIEIAYPEYQNIKKNNEESSLVDIVAINDNTNESLLMQVTKLYPADFWKELHTINKVETQQEVKPLILKALERKQNFDQDEKKKVILLIDSWPGFDKATLGNLSEEFKNKLLYTGYKEIWLVGSLEQLTFKLI